MLFLKEVDFNFQNSSVGSLSIWGHVLGGSCKLLLSVLFPLDAAVVLCMSIIKALVVVFSKNC